MEKFVGKTKIIYLYSLSGKFQPALLKRKNFRQKNISSAIFFLIKQESKRENNF